MAVYTKLSENQLREFFSKYSVGKILNYKEIKEGIENTNYFVLTEQGKFILTLYEKRVEKKDLPFFISLMKATQSFKKFCLSSLNGSYFSSANS